MHTQPLSHNILPFIIFTVLSGLAFHFQFSHFFDAKAEQELNILCQSLTTNPYHRSYVGFKPVDDGVCVLISFFHLVMDASPPIPIITYLFGSALPFVLFTFVEARRDEKNRALSHPFLWLFLTQCATFGLVYPIYALLLVAKGRMSTNRVITNFTKQRVMSLGGAVIIGAVLPSAIMVISNHPIATWIWQFYPAIMFVIERTLLHLLPKKWTLVSGLSEMKIFYQISFVFSASMHLIILARMWRDDISIGLVLGPKTTPPDPSLGLPIQLLHFFKWDLTMGATSLIFATLWFATSVRQSIAIVAWYFAAIPVLGPGAAFMAVIYWKDAYVKGSAKDN